LPSAATGWRTTRCRSTSASSMPTRWR